MTYINDELVETKKLLLADYYDSLK